jgi:hypothetical protein
MTRDMKYRRGGEMPLDRVPCNRIALGASLLALALAPAAAVAAQANLTLSRDVALWSDVIVAHVEGTGCTGGAGEPVVATHGTPWTVDIDLLGCTEGSTAPFSLDVTIGRLFPHEYMFRVRNATMPGSPFLDTATLTTHPTASLAVELPAVVTDAAPFTLTLLAPASTSCVLLGTPVVVDNVIEASFGDICPITPPGGPQVLREDFQVGPLPAGEYEVRFFDIFTERFETPALHRRTIVVHDADRCVPSDTALCLQDGRFRVEAEWEDFAGNQGVGHALPLASDNADNGTADSGTGLLWFFSPGNVEVTVKVIDACDLEDGHWWVFLSSGSSVEYTVTVTDTQTGARREYSNDSGEQAPLRADTSAFPCSAAP